jgi:hypothetical protein
MLKINDLGNCFWLEGEATFFSVAEFIRVSNLKDCPQVRQAVVEELLDIFPDVRIVEEDN